MCTCLAKLRLNWYNSIEMNEKLVTGHREFRPIAVLLNDHNDVREREFDELGIVGTTDMLKKVENVYKSGFAVIKDCGGGFCN